jgi:hypothetical protein
MARQLQHAHALGECHNEAEPGSDADKGPSSPSVLVVIHLQLKKA